MLSVEPIVSLLSGSTGEWVEGLPNREICKLGSQAALCLDLQCITLVATAGPKKEAGYRTEEIPRSLVVPLRGAGGSTSVNVG